MRVQAGAGSREQIGGNVFLFHLRVLLQEGLQISLHTFFQSGVGRCIVVGTRRQACKFRTIVVGLGSILLLHIGIIVIGRGTAPQIIVLCKLLADVLCANHLSVYCHQTAGGLTGEKNFRQPREQQREQQTADQQQYDCHQ